MAKKEAVAVCYRLKPSINNDFEELYSQLKEKGYVINKNSLINILLKKGMESKGLIKELDVLKI